MIDSKTGKVIQQIPTNVTTEPDSTKTVSVKSQDAIVFKQPDGINISLNDFSRLTFSATDHSDNIILSDGTIQIKNLTDGTDESITVTYDLGNRQKITIGTVEVKVSPNGDVSVISQLIDPYGILTDTATGKVISGANLTLYYANTERNIAAGKLPNTAVQLPIINGFKPGDNSNPQISDASGAYGFMVFPNSDYYITATRDGYEKYVSPTISVEKEIVKFDIKMKPTVTKKYNRLPQAGSFIDFTVLISLGVVLILLGMLYKSRKRSLMK